MAVGKIVTGFSKPYVAKYAVASTVVSYTNGVQLSQGVEVSTSADQGDDNNFYADNVISETESGVFTSGEITLTVKGLDQTAEALIMGLAAADADGFITYDDDQSIPDVGLGFIVQYRKDGATFYTPVIYPRVAFHFVDTNAVTRGETVDWQTRELTATVKRAEDAKRSWKKVGGDLATEAAAEDAIKEYFNIQQGTT